MTTPCKPEREYRYLSLRAKALAEAWQSPGRETLVAVEYAVAVGVYLSQQSPTAYGGAPFAQGGLDRTRYAWIVSGCRHALPGDCHGRYRLPISTIKANAL